MRGLVEHQQSGFERHADGDLDPALIAVRQISNELVRALLQPELLENRSSARLRRGQAIQSNEIAAARFETLAGEANVLECAQKKNKLVIWKDRATPSRANANGACPVMSRPSSSTVPDPDAAFPR